MLVLGIETSTPICGIALVEDDTVCAQYTLDLGIHHSEHLFPMIQRVLADRGVRVGDLDGIAVASGPGSFTGLRIGLASAKSLCMSAGVPLVGVSTLAGMAFSIGCEGIPVCAMLDARRDQVYAGIYEFLEGKPVSSLADCAAGIEDVLGTLPRPVLLLGDGAWVHYERIKAHLGADASFVNTHLGRPNAGAIALLGGYQLLQGDDVDIDTFEPQYLRTSQAEQVREARLAKES
ncbi:MAG: tRNA threonylcarbamoyladenosine biosynthesis protein TsaB [Candidatus Latescibacterota bacterium]|jgi:tRNA threonylcarbamoyladenosine biosynthesis protein TsaB